jgi:peptide/nickel transport system substrate-binding protein
LLAACSQKNAPPSELRAAFAWVPATFSPLRATSSYELNLERLVFDPLITFDADGRHAIPILAARVPTLANGDVAKDGRSVVYRLRRGVKWTDGAPFTSADVAFTLHAIVDPRNTVTFREGFDAVSRVDTPDPYTVIFRFDKAYPPAVNTLFADGLWSYGILPKHLLARYPSLDRIPFFDRSPVGTGPYVLQDWKRGDSMTFVANPQYFLGRPRIARIAVKFVSDANTELILAQAHQVDWIYNVLPTALPSYARIPGYVLAPTNENRYDALTFNVRKPPFDDVRLRRAVAMAIDRAAIVRRVFHGSAILAIADIAPIVMSYPPDLRAIPYDPQAARAILAPAKLAVTFAYAHTPSQDQLALLIARDLTAAGVSVDLRPVSPLLAYAPANAGGVFAAGRFDLALTAWASGMDPDNSGLYLCSQRPPAGLNFSGYCSPNMEALQRRALSTIDSQERRRLYEEIERTVVRDVPSVFIDWGVRNNLIAAGLRNFSPNPVTETWNAWQWELSPWTASNPTSTMRR